MIKTFYLQKLNMGIKTTQNFYADFETVEKNVKNLPTKKVSKIGVSPLLYTTNFFCVDFFPIVSTDLKSA